MVTKKQEVDLNRKGYSYGIEDRSRVFQFLRKVTTFKGLPANQSDAAYPDIPNIPQSLSKFSPWQVWLL